MDNGLAAAKEKGGKRILLAALGQKRVLDNGHAELVGLLDALCVFVDLMHT
jgi:hypothetical protein